MHPPPLLSLQNFSLSFGAKRVVEDITFTVHHGETVALVGESGSGKSVTALSLLKLLPNATTTGECFFEGVNIAAKTPLEIQKMRGAEVGFVFQEPLTALNPLHTVQKQLKECLLLHQPQLSKNAMQQKIVQSLKEVELSDTERMLHSYPHQLSGGQRQRVMIAMAIMHAPKLLIADEPTTALDVTTQAHLMALLKKLQLQHGMALLLITHDLALVRRAATRAVVMQHGRVVEQGALPDFLKNSTHPYTQTLLQKMPERLVKDGDTAVIYEARNVSVSYPRHKNFWGKTTAFTKAVNNISLTLKTGQTLGIVGESGSGKTTLGFALLKLLKAEGEFLYQGKPLENIEKKILRREMQVIFQDPFGSLSPRRTVGDSIAEGLDIHFPLKNKTERTKKITAALQEVGLLREMADRYPHEFSGGQRQRIALARALILQPKILVLDEPTSALDVATQRQIVMLLQSLQQKYGMSFVFISHDLAVVRSLAHHIIVMQNGMVVEQGEADTLFTHPQHPYTQELLKAADFR